MSAGKKLPCDRCAVTKPQRVVCPVCGYSWAANKQGVMLTHHWWMGPTKGQCPGSRKTVDAAAQEKLAVDSLSRDQAVRGETENK